MNCSQNEAMFGSDISVQRFQRERVPWVSPDTTYALAPDVLSFRGGQVHVQVADVRLLGVGLETTSDPQGLGAQ